MNGYGSYAVAGSADPAFHSIVAKSHDRNGMALIAYPDAQGNLNSSVASFGWSSNSGVAGAAQTSGVGKWVHFSYVFSNTSHTAKLYANGVLVATKTGFTQDFSGINTQALYLGKFSDRWYPLNGAIDEVRIYNRSLAAAEIASLYSQGGSVSGTIKRLSTYSVTCKNNSTGQTVVIPTTSINSYDCEANGLKFTPNQTVTITINGKTY